jgi:plasmid stabilization system protein ParE
VRNEPLRVEWQPVARSDLEAIFAYLLPTNPFAAERVVQALTVAADSLETFLHRGRPGRVEGTRELTAVWPYIIVYEVRAEAVVILRVWHGARDRGA